MRIIATSKRPRGSASSVRRGVTLLELLVVLVLLGVTAAVVYPALPRFGARDVGEQAAMAAMLDDARRTAVRRGEPLRLRLDTDGVWALVTLRDGATVESGRIEHTERTAGSATPTTTVIVVTIDALGNCVPSGGAPTLRFDPLECTWQRAAAASGS